MVHGKCPERKLELAVKCFAWTPDDAHQIVSNVLKHVNNWAPIMISTAIFPECGSGYHEWNVLLALLREGYNIRDAIFMDSHIQPLWMEEWHKLAQANRVRVKGLDSYLALEQWTKQQPSQHKALVIYINGGLKFGKSYSAKLEPHVSQKSASRFWEWCDDNATNSIAINFMGRDMLHPANCKSWAELALEFTRP